MSDDNIRLIQMMKGLPSLEDFSMISLVRSIIEQDDVRNVFYQHFVPKKHSNVLSEKRSLKIIETCLSVNVPGILESKFLCVVQWMRDELFDYINFIDRSLPLHYFADRNDFISYVMDSVTWNLNGTLNYQFSLQKFFSSLKNIKNSDDPVLMFKIASRFCLEDEIRLIWSKLSDVDKEEFLDKHKYYPYYDEFYKMYFNNTGDRYGYFTFYWACFLSGNKEKFMKYAYLPSQNLYKMVEVEDLNCEADVFFLLFSLFNFKGALGGVKYFCKDRGLNIEKIVMIYLEKFGNGYRHSFEDAEILVFLLSQIYDDEIVKRIFYQFSSVFLKWSVQYWPWNKFLATFVKMCSDGVDQLVFYDFMIDLLDGIQRETTDIFILKNLWNKHLSMKMKESFCAFISRKAKYRDVKNFWQNDRDVKNFWKNVTIEILEMFLNDEKLKAILTPYENEGIFGLVLAQRYDVINYWLEKCLGSEDAIIAFMEDYIIKKSVPIIKFFQRFVLNRLLEFLDWCFKYEDHMDKGKILKAKDQAVESIGVAVIVRNIKLKKWEELKQLIDWIMKNRSGCDNILIDLKEKVLKKIFEYSGFESWCDDAFEKSFDEFLTYGVKKRNVKKLNTMKKELMANIKF